MMELSETQRSLIQNLLGKLSDENAIEMRREIGEYNKELESHGGNKFSSGMAMSKEFDIRFKNLNNLAHKYMAIYLDVLAPQNSPISEKCVDFVLQQIQKNLDGQSKGIIQIIDEYKRANKRFNVDEHFKKKTIDAPNNISQEIWRELLIEQGKRNLNKTAKDNSDEPRVEKFFKKIKNNRILSIIIIGGVIVIAIGTFTDALKTIYNTIKPYIHVFYLDR